MRYSFILTLFILSVCFTSCQKQEKERKPNVVYILADDLGYGDVSALNPNSKIQTPHIDKLASQGMVFHDAHSNAAVCTPTRYGIITGRYCWRSRVKQGVLFGYSPSLIEEKTFTVAEFLKKKGYNTACIGKWHLGLDFRLKDGGYHQGQPGEEFSRELKFFDDHEKIDFTAPVHGGPKGAGFDYSYILPASLDFAPYMYLENNKAVEAPTAYTEGNKPESMGAFWRPGQMAPSFDFEDVLPNITRKAVQYIDNQKDGDQPFFLYFPLTAPHTPWLPSDKYRGTSGAGEYGDFVKMVDAHVGMVLQRLKENGLEESTIVFFASDNGAHWKKPFIEQFNHRSNFIFRGMKADVWEGGHHLPFMVRWPGKIRAGSFSDETVCLTDFYDTMRDLLGEVNMESNQNVRGPADSYSMLPLLLEQKRSVNRPPVIHLSGWAKFGIRDGNWKYIEGLGSGGFTNPRNPEPGPGDPEGQLYNLQNDPGEQQNRYQQEKAKVREMQAKLKQIRGY